MNTYVEMVARTASGWPNCCCYLLQSGALWPFAGLWSPHSAVAELPQRSSCPARRFAAVVVLVVWLFAAD